MCFSRVLIVFVRLIKNTRTKIPIGTFVPMGVLYLCSKGTQAVLCELGIASPALFCYNKIIKNRKRSVSQ